MKKVTIILSLHPDGSNFLLDEQDMYQTLTVITEKEAELEYYIGRLVEARNYPFLHNPEMAFDNGEEARLRGWLDGYDFAKHHRMSRGGTTITGSWYVIHIPENPYKNEES